jgi:uncharacterized protein (DUF2249 family)
MSQTSAPTLRLDVREIAPRERHARIFASLSELDVNDSLEIVVDHDPRPLYLHLSQDRPGQFGWEYLERGPATWRVLIERVARTHGSGSCCGSCGGGA